MISKIARVATGTTLAAGVAAVIAATSPVAFADAGAALDAASLHTHTHNGGAATSAPTLRAVNLHGHLALRGTGFAPGGYDYITMVSPQLDPGGTYFTAGATASAAGTVTFTTPFLAHCPSGSPTGTVGATDGSAYKSSNEVQVTLCKSATPDR